MHLASRLHQVNGIWRAWKPDPSRRDRQTSIAPTLKFATKGRGRDILSENSPPALALLQHSQGDRGFDRGDRL
jgi:hypothetical protein